MNDILSQEEIEALLRGEVPSSDDSSASGEDLSEEEASEEVTSDGMPAFEENVEDSLQEDSIDVSNDDDKNEVEDVASNNQEILETDENYDNLLTDIEKDAIGEIGNISMGTSATTLSTLLNRKVSITTPTVSVTTPEIMASEHPLPFVAIDVSWQIGLEGSNVMILNSDDVKIIADLMMGKQEGFDTSREITEIDLSAVSEAMNQMMGSTSTSLSEMFSKKVDISPPQSMEVTFDEAIDTLDVLKQKGPIIAISFRMVVEDLLDTSFVQLIPVDFGKEMVSYLLGGAQESEKAPEPPPASKPAVEVPPVAPAATSTPVAEPAVQPTPPPPSPSQPQYQPPPPQHVQEPVMVREPQFASFDQSYQNQRVETIDLVGDIPVELTVELGRTNKKIAEILEFSQGTVVELNKLVGESLDIYANGKYIAKGEVVVIDDNFGVRVTDIENINKNLV